MGPRLPFAFLLCVFLGGCSTVDRLNAPALEGKPGETGLVVVRAEATLQGFRDTSGQVVVGGTLLRVGQGDRIEGKAAAGYIVFSGLAPGDYLLETVHTTWTDLNYTIRHRYAVGDESTAQLAVRAGEPAFIGFVRIREVRSAQEGRVYVEWRRTREDEAAAWRWFSGVFGAHPWAEAARRRLAALGS